MNIQSEIIKLHESLPPQVTLVAVSKTYPPDVVMQAYEAGQRIFGENRPQELRAKYEALPQDIRWHMIGTLQTNKVKYIAPFVEMIHSVDSDKLLAVIDKEAAKNSRIIDVLFEVHIAREESKHGWDADVLKEYLHSGEHLKYKNIRFRGLMGMATFTDDRAQIRKEFAYLRDLFDRIRLDLGDNGGREGNPGNDEAGAFDTLSMGMTSDYDIAVECGSTMVRIGSLIFGAR